MSKNFEHNFLETFSDWEDLSELTWQVYKAVLKPNVFPEHLDLNQFYTVYFDLNNSVIEVYLEDSNSDTPVYSGGFTAKLT